MTNGCGSKELEAAFVATVYRVDTAQGCFELRIGVEPPDFNAFLIAQGVMQWAVLTAWNPGAKEYPLQENIHAQAILLARIDKLGYRYLPARNQADGGLWPVEESVLVLGMCREDACRLTAESGQLACVTGMTGGSPELVWADEHVVV